MNSSSHYLQNALTPKIPYFSYLHISFLYMTVRNFSLLTLIERIFLSEFQLFALHRNEGPFRRDGNEKNALLTERQRERDCFAGTVTRQYTVEFCIRCTRNSMINPLQHTLRQVKCMRVVGNLYKIDIKF